MSIFTDGLNKIVDTFQKVGLGPVPTLGSTNFVPSPYRTANPNDNQMAFGPNPIASAPTPKFTDNSKTGLVLNTISGIMPQAATTVKDIAQSTARSFASTGLSLMGKKQLEETPTSRVLYGAGPVKDIQTRISDTKTTIKESPFAQKYGADKYAGPLAFAGVVGGTVLDLTPWGGGKAVKSLTKEVPEAFIKYIASEADEMAINSTLRAIGVDEVNAIKLAKELAPASTVDEVKDVLVKYEIGNIRNALGPKVQMSDEGVPMARKDVPMLPALKTPPKPKATKIPEQPAVPKSIYGLTKQNLAPLKFLDQGNADTFRQWNSDNIIGKEFANNTYQTTKIDGDGMNLINRYQAGEPNPQIKGIFDQLFNEANKRGVEVPYRQNYVPQVYKGTYNDVQKSIAKYLTDNGVTDEQALEYIKGINPLPNEVALRLKLSPNFEKERVFPDYKTAQEYGLVPKYQTVSELAAHYRGELEKAVANNKLIDTLKKRGVLKPADSQFAPSDWQIVNTEFSGPKLMKAPPNVAKVINNIFADPNARGLFGTLVKGVGETSAAAQNIVLSAGAPGSNVNFFAIGQLNKELTSGNAKAAKAFLQTNSKSSTVKYFNNNKDTIMRMANQGIDVTNRMGVFGKDNLLNLLSEKEYAKALGFSIDKVFGEKTFQGFMPMMQTQLFKDVYNSGIRKGLSGAEAEKLAGDIIKKNFGLNTDAFARSEITKDTLKAVFFAPRFREGIINVLGNTGKAGLNLLNLLRGSAGKIDPSLSRNRRLLAGMILVYAGYNAINKKLNGNYMWDNPENRKFALRIPLPNGDVTYIEFMPSFLAFARNMASGVLSTGKGDFDQATQQFGSVFSIPIKLTSEVIGNRDYFGSAIYKDTDSTLEKTKKIAAHLGLGISHPYVKEVVNQIQDKKPMYQSIITGLELPLKFSTKDKEEANKIFNVMDKQNQDRADMTKLSEKEHNRLKSLSKEEANGELRKIYDTNPDLYEKIKNRAEADKMGLTDNERYIKMLDIDHRAQYIFERLQDMTTKEEKNAYIADLAKKKIVTKDTYAELSKLIKGK